MIPTEAHQFIGIYGNWQDELESGMLDQMMHAFFICTGRFILQFPAPERLEQNRN